MMGNEEVEESSLVLAAEDCSLDDFRSYHVFTKSDRRIISKLLAHGPVLLKGGRGSGKSALMLEAFLNMAPKSPGSTVFGIYLSLRHLDLLRSEGENYEVHLCKLLVDKIKESLKYQDFEFNSEHKVYSVQKALSELSSNLKKRIVILFDDAAHIGREAPLIEFFDIFRTLSSSVVSCKAAIYPGVTRFGTRFDVYNDATVIDVSRHEEHEDFDQLYSEVLKKRFPHVLPEKKFSKEFDLDTVASFLGQSVLGNMRGFVFACNALNNQLKHTTIGLGALTDTLIYLATNYYWPLLEELKPKLGMYEPMIETSLELADILFDEAGEKQKKNLLVFRDIVNNLSKPFEILEYAGFISRRDVSRAMKSGGRGSRYLINYCNLLEKVKGSRLTSEIYTILRNKKDDPIEFHKGSKLTKIKSPELHEGKDLSILDEPISKLKKSNAYPYGLTDAMITTLTNAGHKTVRDLAYAADHDFSKLDGIAEQKTKRIKNTVLQAIWM